MPKLPDYRPSERPDWQPYKDKDGNVVTITPDQCAAIFHAARVYESVIKYEQKLALDGERDRLCNPAFNVRGAIEASQLITKSCLMGRLLYDGLPPLADAPPVLHAAPQYPTIDANKETK